MYVIDWFAVHKEAVIAALVMFPWVTLTTIIIAALHFAVKENNKRKRA